MIGGSLRLLQNTVTLKRLLRYASILYRNNKENKIVVDADGLTDRKVQS